MIVYTLISPYRLANSYLIEIEPGKFVGVDIGNIAISEITSIIDVNCGTLLAYFLTHAHGDHTVGIKAIWDLYQMPIYCSQSAAYDINDSRKNFSIYSEEIATFQYNLKYTIVHDESIVKFDDKTFQISAVPGHSPGCIIIQYDDAIFTGDFVMKDFKTPLNLPNSSRADYAISIKKFFSKFENHKHTFYPGHGAAFCSLDNVFFK